MTKIENTVRDLTLAYIAHTKQSEGVRGTYLQTLTAEVQRELGVEPRTNNATKRGRLSNEAQATQLAAIAAVHARFYAIVVDTVEKSLAGIPSKEWPSEKNRRTNFARTALYAVRLYVRAGKDLTAVAPGKLTKSALAVTVVGTTASPRRLKGRVERASKAFVKSLLALSEADKDAAVAELDTLIGQMATQLAALGMPATRNPRKAAEDHVPLQVGKQLFVPTASTVLRQRARPS